MRSGIPLHILSDSTGNLAGHMITAFLTQFPPGAFVVKRHNFLSTRAKLDDALHHAGSMGGIVFHAMVQPSEKQRIREFFAHRGMAVCDLTGQFVEFLSTASGIQPQSNVRTLHEVSDEYRARIKALEFTLEHDDGLGLETLHEADVVLAGVSRTSKTPTSIYLGQQGYKCANYALAMPVPPPRELLALPPHKVIGLTIDAVRLAEVRHVRRQAWSMGQGGYTDIDDVQKEIAWSRRLFAQQGWKTIDVTNSAIEETAHRIVEMLGLPHPSSVAVRPLTQSDPDTKDQK